jgi:hypothetical protein
MAGSLAYDPMHDEIVLFGGGHVAEQGRDGRIVGYTGTWLYRFQENRWLPLALETQPPPRMNTRLVCDTKNQQLVLFGGDAQSHYLADTWIFDLKTRTWRQSKAASGPEARAGHFTVYDPETGWVIIGGGYNQKISPTCGPSMPLRIAGWHCEVKCRLASISVPIWRLRNVSSCSLRIRRSLAIP